MLAWKTANHRHSAVYSASRSAVRCSSVCAKRWRAPVCDFRKSFYRKLNGMRWWCSRSLLFRLGNVRRNEHIRISGADECFDSSDEAYGEHQIDGWNARMPCRMQFGFVFRAPIGSLAAWLTGVCFTVMLAPRAIRWIHIYTKIQFSSDCQVSLRAFHAMRVCLRAFFSSIWAENWSFTSLILSGKNLWKEMKNERRGNVKRRGKNKNETSRAERDRCVRRDCGGDWSECTKTWTMKRERARSERGNGRSSGAARERPKYEHKNQAKVENEEEEEEAVAEEERERAAGNIIINE